jgi:hypothetical protein
MIKVEENMPIDTRCSPRENENIDNNNWKSFESPDEKKEEIKAE